MYIHGQYSMTTPQKDLYQINRDFSPFSHSIKGYAPTIGIHLSKKLSRKLEIEGFVAGGPLFAECMYAFSFHITSNSEDKIIQEDFLTTFQRTEEKSSGTGIALNVGARINFNLTRIFGLFFQGGYNYWMVNDLSGPGKTIYNNETKTWHGDWVIKEHYHSDEWGTFKSVWPSNYPGDPQYRVVRDFKLDLSGFSIKAGLFFRF